MRQILMPIKAMAENCQNIGILFSGGRDSIVMLDLFMTHARKSVKNIIFMYFCPGLSFDEKILQYYENRFKIKIDRIPHVDTSHMITERKKGKKLTMADQEKWIRQEFEVDFLAMGYRKDESLQRRGIMAHLDEGIDWKYRKVYPLMDWSKKHVQGWIDKQKLLLPETYKIGWRDINALKGDSLLYVMNNYPKDYQKIIKMYPDIQAEVLRMTTK